MTNPNLPEHVPGMVRVLQAGGYMVASASTPGAWWFVYGQECSCPATVARCRHLRMVDAFCRALDAAHKPAAVKTNVSAMVD